jgi:uncharacterized membrane protein YvlD (DUF360 family)
MLATILRFGVTVAAIPLCARFMDGVHLINPNNALLLGIVLAILYTLIRPLLRLVFKLASCCTMGLVNVLLDLLFVARFNWGVAGAAAATVASQAAAMLLALSASFPFILTSSRAVFIMTSFVTFTFGGILFSFLYNKCYITNVILSRHLTVVNRQKTIS